MGVLLVLLLALSCCPNKTSASRVQSPPSAYSRRPGRGDLYHHYYSQHQQQPQHYLQYHHQINYHNPGDGLSEGILEGGDPYQNGEEEDPNWWDGAEEIDLTQKTHHYPDPYPDSLHLIPLSSLQGSVQDFLEDPESLFFGSCGDENVCELGSFPPPPELFVPPPPVPPFMPGLAAMLGTEGGLPGEELPPIGGRTPDGTCTMCHWANEGNSSAAVFIVENEDTDGGLAGLLAGVAVGSAVTGAILTAVLIRCRRSKILPTVKDSCPVLPRGSWSTSGGERSNAAPKPPSTGHSSAPTEGVEPVVAGGGETTTRTGWAMKLWRLGSSQERPLRPTSSYSSENSYTEEPYVNTDGSSALYAELAPGLNTYSEIPDPGRPHPQMVHPNFVVGVSDYGYGNSAYALSEAPSEPAESSSTPSSAYYSDVSTDAQANKKKRKKKKGNEREVIMSTGCSFGMMPTNISSTVPIMTARLGDNMHPISSGELCRSSSTQEGLPIPVRFLPRSYSLERQGVTYSCTPCHACTPISTLPIMRHACELSAVVLTPANHAVITHHLTPCAGDPSIKFAANTSVGQVFHGTRAPDIANTSVGQVFHGTMSPNIANTSVGQVFHSTMSPNIANTSVGQVFHSSRPSDLQTVNTVTCSPHTGPLMCHNPQLMCRQEQPLPCPPSEYV